MVGHVLVSILVLAFVGVLLQVTLALHVRNVAIDAAWRGAQFAARDNVSAAEGIARTKQILTADLGGAYAQNVTSFTQVDPVTGGEMVGIEVLAPVPVIGPYNLGQDMRLRAHVLKEPSYG